MSSFFTKPASLKRKRNEAGPAAQRPQRKTTGERQPKRRVTRDESISGSDAEDDDLIPVNDDLGLEESESESEDEDAAGRRTRLAERYLENTRREILTEGFDAKDLDAELLAERMGERLKEDTAESKGKVYKWIADDYDFAGAIHTQFRADTLSVTGVATCAPYIYTVAKDTTLIKWEMPEDNVTTANGTSTKPMRRKPKQLKFARGNGKMANDLNYKYHTGSILCVAASGDGKFVATGGVDRKLIIWDAATLQPLRVFTQHRDSVTSLTFRRGTNQLFSASKDRTIKLWSLDELAYVETLFGHQDEVIDVAALNDEKCVTVGARDRTARYWRVVEESQLVFRGGGGASSGSHKRRKDGSAPPEIKTYNEGSIDRVTMVDEETFVTGSDNGSLSLWNLQKKKAVFTYSLAHGLDPPPNPDEVSAEADPSTDPSVSREAQPRWITSLACLPFSNIIVSGSWDGQVRAWKISEDKRRLEALGAVGAVEKAISQLPDGDDTTMGVVEGLELEVVPESTKTVRGVVNDLAIFERGERGKEVLTVVAAAGKEHRLGRWTKMAGKNYAMVFQVSKRSVNGTLENGHASEDL